MTTTRSLESDARYVLLSSFAEGRRVLDLGCGDGTGLLQLVEAGAVEIVATCVKPHEARNTLSHAEIEGVQVSPDFRPPLGFDDGSFDLIICNDLPERLAENEEWYSELRRLLDTDGCLALAVAASDGGQYLSEVAGERGHSPMGYEELYEKLADDFGDAVIFGQSPVVAHLFYDFSSEDEDPGLTLDGSLLGEDGEDPGWYVMVFGPDVQGRDDLLFVRLDFGRVVGAVRGGATARPMAAPPSLSGDEVEALRRDLDLAEQEANEAGELRELWGHAERTIASQEQDLREERMRATHANEALNNALLDVARLQSNLDSTAGLHANLSFARQAVAEQEETVRRFDDQKLALGDELKQRGEAIARLESLLSQGQSVLKAESDLLRRADQRAGIAEEQLAVIRLESYRAQNELQKERDEWGRERKSLDGAREELFGDQAMLHTRIDEANERRQNTERELGQQRDRIAELEKNLQGAEQMFERTKAELIKIEQGAAERIQENEALTQALMQQSAMAAEVKFKERVAALEEEKNAAIEESKAAAQKREQQLEADHEEQLEEVRGAAGAEGEKKLEEVRAAAEGRERSLNEQLQKARDEMAAEIEAANKRAAAELEERSERVRREVKTELGAQVGKELEERLAQAKIEADARIQETETKQAEAEAKLADAEARVAAAEQATQEQLDQQRQQTNEHLAALEQDTAKKLEQAEAETKKRLVEVENQVREAGEARQQLAEELEAANERVTTSEEAKNLAEQDIMAYLQRLQAAEERAKKAESMQSDAVEKIKSEAKQKISAAKEKVRSASDARDALQQELSALLVDLDQQREHTQRLEGEAVAQAQLAGTKERVEELEKSLRSLTEERDALAIEVQSLTDAAHHEESVPTIGPADDDDEPEARTVIDGNMLAMLQKRDAEEAAKKKQEKKDALGREVEAGPDELEDLSPDS